jgi:uncharacterized protein involved in exopolysaccharide biosynthesis
MRGQERNIEGAISVMIEPDFRQDTITIREMAQLAWKHKKFVMKVTAVCGAMGILTALLLPVRYQADTEILPPQEDSSLGAMMAGVGGMAGAAGSMLAAGAGSGLGLKDQNALYIGMLVSRAAEDPIIQQFDLRAIYKQKLLSGARKKLEWRTSIESTKEGFIQIKVTDSDGKRAAAMANAYAEQLRRITSSMAVTEAGKRRIFFDQETKKSHDQLTLAEQHMKDMQQKTGLIELQGQGMAAIEQVAEVRGQIAAEQIRLKELLTYTTENFPDVVTLKQEIAGLQNRLAELQKQPGAGDGDSQLSTKQLPETGMEFLRSVRDVRYYESMYELLAKELELSKLDEAREGGVVQVLYPAVEPEVKSWPPRTIIVLLSLLLGFFGANLRVVTRERSLDFGQPFGGKGLNEASAPAGNGRA